MSFLLGGFSVLLLACGLGLLGLGVEMSFEGAMGGGLLSLAFGALTVYGAYLFARASRRVRAAIDQRPTPRRASTSRKITLVLVFVGISSAWVLAAPIPGAEQAVFIAIVVLGTLVAAAAMAEPPKRRNPPSR